MYLSIYEESKMNLEAIEKTVQVVDSWFQEWIAENEKKDIQERAVTAPAPIIYANIMSKPSSAVG